MKLNDVIHTGKDIVSMGHTIENNMIENVDIRVVGHFGNACSLDIFCSNVGLFGGYNNTRNVGFLIRAFIELFDLSEEDGISIDKLKNIPCRIIMEGSGGWGGRCIGFGHFMKDKFVLRDDFAKIDE